MIVFNDMVYVACVVPGDMNRVFLWFFRVVCDSLVVIQSVSIPLF
jgi:hypothetical protein